VTAAPKISARPPAREVILGIDPGSIFTGWGVIELDGSQLRHGGHGVIATSTAAGQAERIKQIYRGIDEVIRRHRPAAVSLEKVFFSRNVQSALKLGQARGVAMLAAAEHEIAVSEYSATEIKVGVVGYGHATKEQIQKMVCALLGLRGAVRADAADALAAAICHIHRQTFQTRTGGAVKHHSAKGSWRDYTPVAAKR
jgi:crossover junction endodeoxyribonuclease RuvC